MIVKNYNSTSKNKISKLIWIKELSNLNSLLIFNKRKYSLNKDCYKFIIRRKFYCKKFLKHRNVINI